MLSVLKKYVIYAMVGGALYFFLSYHIIFFGGRDLALLKKTEIKLDYTIFSAQDKPAERILYIDELREAGVGDLLVERGIITEDERLDLEMLVQEEDYVPPSLW